MRQTLRSRQIIMSYPQPRPRPNVLSHLNKFYALFLAVIPEAVVDPEAQQLQRWLRAKKVVGWHVEVIQKAHQALPTCWYEHAFGSLF